MTSVRTEKRAQLANFTTWSELERKLEAHPFGGDRTGSCSNYTSGRRTARIRDYLVIYDATIQ